jgi:hypothetical protein
MKFQELKCALLFESDSHDPLLSHVIAGAKWIREDGTPWGVKGEATNTSKAEAIAEAMAKMVQAVLDAA